MSNLESFGERLSAFDPHLFIVSGLQMMDNFPFKEGERRERIDKIKERKGTIRTK